MHARHGEFAKRYVIKENSALAWPRTLFSVATIAIVPGANLRASRSLCSFCEMSVACVQTLLTAHGTCVLFVWLAVSCPWAGSTVQFDGFIVACPLGMAHQCGTPANCRVSCKTILGYLCMACLITVKRRNVHSQS